MRQAILIIAALLVIGMVAWKLCFPRAGTPLAIPALPKQWHDQVYGLDDDEVIRFIAPPFPLQRATGLLAVGQLTGQTLHLVRPNGRVDPAHWTSRMGTVRSALAHCVDISNAELRVEGHAGGVVVDGDWIVRAQTPDQRRMQALALILQSATERKIEITWNPIYAYCVVVQGSWNRPENGPDEPKTLRFAQIVTKDTPGVIQGPPEDFLRILEENCRCRFINETGDRPNTVSWLDDAPSGFWDAVERRSIFRTLESQTSLRFTESRRPISIWTVRERPAENHSGGTP